jgi:hypothetical protein
VSPATDGAWRGGRARFPEMATIGALGDVEAILGGKAGTVITRGGSYL